MSTIEWNGIGDGSLSATRNKCTVIVSQIRAGWVATAIVRTKRRVEIADLCEPNPEFLEAVACGSEFLCSR